MATSTSSGTAPSSSVLPPLREAPHPEIRSIDAGAYYHSVIEQIGPSTAIRDVLVKAATRDPVIAADLEALRPRRRVPLAVLYEAPSQSTQRQHSQQPVHQYPLQPSYITLLQHQEIEQQRVHHPPPQPESAFPAKIEVLLEGINSILRAHPDSNLNAIGAEAYIAAARLDMGIIPFTQKPTAVTPVPRREIEQQRPYQALRQPGVILPPEARDLLARADASLAVRPDPNVEGIAKADDYLARVAEQRSVEAAHNAPLAQSRRPAPPSLAESYYISPDEQKMRDKIDRMCHRILHAKPRKASRKKASKAPQAPQAPKAPSPRQRTLARKAKDKDFSGLVKKTETAMGYYGRFDKIGSGREETLGFDVEHRLGKHGEAMIEAMSEPDATWATKKSAVTTMIRLFLTVLNAPNGTCARHNRNHHYMLASSFLEAVQLLTVQERKLLALEPEWMRELDELFKEAKRYAVADTMNIVKVRQLLRDAVNPPVIVIDDDDDAGSAASKPSSKPGEKIIATTRRAETSTTARSSRGASGYTRWLPGIARPGNTVKPAVTVVIEDSAGSASSRPGTSSSAIVSATGGESLSVAESSPLPSNYGRWLPSHGEYIPPDDTK